MTAETNTSTQTLSTQFSAVSQELIDIINSCSTEEWHKITSHEDWSVGVTARHIATAHFGSISFVQSVVDGESLPPLTLDMIHEANAQHAGEHANCAKLEVLEILQTNAATVLNYLQECSDEALARTAYFSLADSEISAENLFIAACLDPAQTHLASIKAAVAG